MSDSDKKAPQETQDAFRARMRATYGDGRNGTLHWKNNPAAQAEIAARKAMKDQAWQAQLQSWKTDRAVKKAMRQLEHDARVQAAKAAPSVEAALRILGVA